MTDKQGMSTEDVITRLRKAADWGEIGEAPQFSERYAMRLAADRLSALEAENARMRAVVAAVAKEGWYMDAALGCLCVFPLCGGTGMAPSTIDHAADCPVTIARALLASASDAKEAQ